MRFTTVIAVDAEHFAELQCVWPTWQKYKPEIFDNPLLILRDAAFQFPRNCVLVHPNITVKSVDNHCTTQRDKMLWALLVDAPQYVDTAVWMKIDTDAVATGPGGWIDPVWLDPQINQSFAMSPWPYTKPVNALEQLDAWYPANDGQPIFPGNCRPDPENDRIHYPRTIGWLSFINTQFSRNVAAVLQQHPPPIISHDTLLWYLAERRGSPYHKVKMSQYGWEHRKGLRSLQKAVAAVLPCPATPVKVPAAPPHSRVCATVIADHFGNHEPRIGVEIGVYRGETSEHLLRRFPELTLVMVDPWAETSDRRVRGDRISRQKQAEHDDCRRQAYERTAEFRHRRIICEMPSIAAIPAFSGLDFGFIDALHFFEAVRDDIATLWPQIRSGGIMLGHDIHHRRHVGVTRAVTEFAEREGLELKVHRRKIWSIVKD